MPLTGRYSTTYGHIALPSRLEARRVLFTCHGDRKEAPKGRRSFCSQLSDKVVPCHFGTSTVGAMSPRSRLFFQYLNDSPLPNRTFGQVRGKRRQAGVHDHRRGEEGLVGPADQIPKQRGLHQDPGRPPLQARGPQPTTVASERPFNEYSAEPEWTRAHDTLWQPGPPAQPERSCLPGPSRALPVASW
jgi:hypothetical protein